MRRPVSAAKRKAWRDGRLTEGTRSIPEETALALTYNGGTYAVMMGTPQDLADFAIGFSLNEGIVQSPDEIETLDIVELDDGIELRMWLSSDKAALLSERRRHIAGPTGCGLCGIDSIAEAIRPAAVVTKGRSFTPREIIAAMAAMAPLQKINIETRAVHGAAFWTARGCRPPQRARQARRLSGTREIRRQRGHGAADEPGFRRDGAEDGRDRRALDGRGVGADRACGTDGGSRRHYARSYRPRRRF
jgi:FdhD/NarQ family